MMLFGNCSEFHCIPYNLKYPRKLKFFFDLIIKIYVIPQEKKIIPPHPLSKEEQLLLSKVDDQKENLIKLLQQLIQIDSTNLSENQFVSRDAIFNFTENYLKQQGFQTQIYRAPFSEKESYPNLVSWLQGSTSGPKLQFNGHLDIVPFDKSLWDSKYDPLGGLVEEGRIYGRGACDMKSGVACQIIAMNILKESKIDFNGKLQLWLTPDEETHGKFGSVFMTKNHITAIQADATIISESTTTSPLQTPVIAVGEKGPLWLKLTFLGAAGHGSMPKSKSNAINKAVRFMSNLKQLKIPKVSPPVSLITMFKNLLKRYSISDLLKALKLSKSGRNPYDEDGNALGALFKSTFSCDVFSSGTKVNVIPDQANLEIDIRLLPNIKLNDVFDAFNAYSARMGYHMKLPKEFTSQKTIPEKITKRPIDIQVEILTYGEGSMEDLNSSSFALVKNSFEAVYQVQAIHAFSSGFTDAGNLRQSGLKNIFIIGPSGANFHGINEYAEIDSLIWATKMYLLLAYRFLAKKEQIN